MVHSAGQLRSAVGVAIPQFGSGASPEAIARVAREAEKMGLGSVWVQERILLPTNPQDQYGGGPGPDLMPRSTTR